MLGTQQATASQQQARIQHARDGEVNMHMLKQQPTEATAGRRIAERLSTAYPLSR